jgi:hypothetical protein
MIDQSVTEGRAPIRLDGPAALEEAVDDNRGDNKNHRERQEPGPPAVSCDEHIDLPFMG